MRRPALLALLLLAPLADAARQVDVGTAIGPETFSGGSGEKRRPPPTVLPLALATVLTLDATTWADVSVSTASPAQDLTKLLRQGVYKLELFQLLVMARRSKTPLSKLAEERAKGERLRAMASRLNVDYDSVYDEAAALGRRVEARLPSVLSVERVPAGRE